jgi:hypothetical protein
MTKFRPLPDLTDAELREALVTHSQNVYHSYDSIMAEMDRRAARRQATAQFVLSVVAIVIAVIALVVSALRPA